MSILFRCDGSINIGMGHIVRCITLANYIKERNKYKIFFALKKSSIALDYIDDKFPVFIKNNSSLNNLDWLLECANKIQAKVIVFDVRNDISRRELIQFKKNYSCKTVCIDDPEEKSKEADVVFFPPVPQTQDIKLKEFKGKVFVGWEFVIIREIFKNNKLKNKNKNKIPRVVISFGGTDKNNNTCKVVKILNEISIDFDLDIIVGPGYTFSASLKDLLKTYEKKYRLFKNPNNFHEIVSYADIGIISFGQTAYEFAALNVPSLYFCSSIDHSISAKLFESNNIGKSVGIEPITNEKIKITIKNFLNQILKRSNSICFFKPEGISNLDLISNLILEEKN